AVRRPTCGAVAAGPPRPRWSWSVARTAPCRRPPGRRSPARRHPAREGERREAGPADPDHGGRGPHRRAHLVVAGERPRARGGARGAAARALRWAGRALLDVVLRGRGRRHALAAAPRAVAVEPLGRRRRGVADGVRRGGGRGPRGG